MKKLLIPLLFLLVSCDVPTNKTTAERQDAAANAFTNAIAKATSDTLCNAASQQFIVKCQDGSIWEILVDTQGTITYKNCLFDPINTNRPTITQITLEK